MTTTEGAGGRTARLVAPVTGVLVPLEQVPDPGFARKIVGDGVSIDPLGTEVVAPCDGTVVVVHPSRHAVSVASPDGLEVLVHVGIDTVGLEGKGFSAHVEQGSRVRAGDRLLTFDADYVATHAQALLTQVLVTNGDRVRALRPATGVVTAGKDVVLDIELAPEARSEAPAPAAGAANAPEAGRTTTEAADVGAMGENDSQGGPERTDHPGDERAAHGQDLGEDLGDDRDGNEGDVVHSDPIVIMNPIGLHARPAAVLVNAAKPYTSKILLFHGGEMADVKSIMMLLALGIPKGAEIHLLADGPDAREAIDDLTAQIRAGLGEDVDPPPGVASPTAIPAPDAGADPVLAVVPARVRAATTAARSAGPSGLDPGAPAPAAAPLVSSSPAAAGPAGAPPPAGPVPPPVPEAPEAPDCMDDADDTDVLHGVPASPGIGVGPVVHVRRAEFELAEYLGTPDDERHTLEAAIGRADAELKALRDDLAARQDDERSAIFAAHQEILHDPAISGTAFDLVGQGKSAGWAWREAFTRQADVLAGLDDEVLAGRATDVRDVGRRVLGEITGQKADTGELPADAILVAEDLTPSDTARLDRSKVAGFATVHGGASSHVAIIARSLDIPAVAGIEPRALELAEGERVVLDGSKGTLRTGVPDAELGRIATLQERRAARRELELAAAEEPAITSDGHHVEVVANIGNLDDARQAQTVGAEGVGLLRSEFVFLDRSEAPTEDEQAAIYTGIAEALRPGQPLVIRTLDVGGDKPLPYLPIPAEENPFLGERGVRVGLAQPDLLRTQARAILRAADAGARIHVMFPMVATLEDLRRAKAIFEEEREALGTDPVPVGIMVEVPSVAVMARQFAAEADFFSVGTNDLTQYTLAMDRGHPRLAPQVDGCNPAVLGLIAHAVEAAHEAGKWVGVCGALASDPQAVPILVGLGVDELSASIPAVPSVKAQIRATTLAECQDLARRALAADTAAAVRALVTLDDDA